MIGDGRREQIARKIVEGGIAIDELLIFTIDELLYADAVIWFILNVECTCNTAAGCWMGMSDDQRIERVKGLDVSIVL